MRLSEGRERVASSQYPVPSSQYLVAVELWLKKQRVELQHRCGACASKGIWLEGCLWRGSQRL